MKAGPDLIESIVSYLNHLFQFTREQAGDQQRRQVLLQLSLTAIPAKGDRPLLVFAHPSLRQLVQKEEHVLVGILLKGHVK